MRIKVPTSAMGQEGLNLFVNFCTSLTLLLNLPPFQAGNQGLLTFYLGVAKASQQA